MVASDQLCAVGGAIVTHVLIVEDEPSLRLLLTRLMNHAGYQVTASATGSAGLREALNGHHDLVLLDLMLPDLPGEDVLRVLLTARPEAKVIVLSSVTEVGRRVGVLDGGAADFVAKPFGNSELLARVRARIRTESVSRPTPTNYLVNGRIRVDIERRTLVIGNEEIALSQREFVLLTHLIRRRGQVCSRAELLSQVWGIGFDPGTNVVDVYVRRLRAKLTADAIETVRNVGYRLAAG